VQKKVQNKLEILWQDFEKTGSIAAYLEYRQKKEVAGKPKKRAPNAKLTSKSKP
jgi:hypothetical protein